MKYFQYLAAILVAFTMMACNNDDNKSDVRPGLWTELDLIETFPGDTVLISGQVSNYIGLDRLVISCDAWGINKVYSLDGEHTKVFNFNYSMVVPDDATFDQVLKITVVDTEGSENKKSIAMTYLPGTEQPVSLTDIPSQIGVEYDTDALKGIYNLKFELSDSRQLKAARIEIPGIAYDKTLELKGRSATINERIEFPTAGNYPMTLTVTNENLNSKKYLSEIVVMPKEEENEIQDYPQMYMVCATENPADYMLGYYRFMYREAEMEYSCKRFYAPTDNYTVYFVPEKNMNCPDRFGVSPYVSSKLMNNKDYVVPVTIEKKGYYGIWLKLADHSFTIWPESVDGSTIYTGEWRITGSGFSSFWDWNFSEPMQPVDGNNYRRSIDVEINLSFTDTRYVLVTDGTWGRTWRSDGSWWWYNDPDGGGPSAIYESIGSSKARFTFDAAELWGTMKKIDE